MIKQARWALMGFPALALGAAMSLPAGAGDDDRILRKQIEVTAPLSTVWNAWTTEEGLKFISPRSRVELRVGGPYEWFLNLEADEQGKRGSQGSQVLAFLPQEILAFSWTFPPSVPTLRNANVTTQIVVRFEERDDGVVVVHFAQLGWQDGEDWQAGYEYFDRAWNQVLGAMQRKFGVPDS